MRLKAAKRNVLMIAIVTCIMMGSLIAMAITSEKGEQPLVNDAGFIVRGIVLFLVPGTILGRMMGTHISLDDTGIQVHKYGRGEVKVGWNSVQAVERRFGALILRSSTGAKIPIELWMYGGKEEKRDIQYYISNHLPQLGLNWE